MKIKSQYEQLGVDASKERVRQIFRRIVDVDSDFLGAFVNIVRHPDRPGVVITKHPDGDGSKMVQRLLHFLVTGDERIIRGAVDDAIAMNTGDIAASGFVFGWWFITQIFNINGKNVPKNLIMAQIAERVEELLALYRQYGFKIKFVGGETADLVDQVLSVVYDVDVQAEAAETEVILGNSQPGDKIWGFASDGQAVWEDEPNSGGMANGYTMARNRLMHADYGTQYPFLIRQPGGSYRGAFLVGDKPAGLESLGDISVSKALLSPTRQWAILIRLLIEKLKQEGIFSLLHGISMNTGGGAIKVVHIGKGGIIYDKTMPEPPCLFHLIQKESEESWRNMFWTFNCGVGIDVVAANDPRVQGALDKVSELTGIKLFELGECQQGGEGPNKVVLHTPYGDFNDY